MINVLLLHFMSIVSLTFHEHCCVWDRCLGKLKSELAKQASKYLILNQGSIYRCMGTVAA